MQMRQRLGQCIALPLDHHLLLLDLSIALLQFPESHVYVFQRRLARVIDLRERHIKFDGYETTPHLRDIRLYL